MDRTKYLQMARECAMLTERGMFDIPVNVPERLQVVYDGIRYYPYAYDLSFFPDGSVRHIAVLHDLKANAVVGAPLNKVERKAAS